VLSMMALYHLGFVRTQLMLAQVLTEVVVVVLRYSSFILTP